MAAPAYAIGELNNFSRYSIGRLFSMWRQAKLAIGFSLVMLWLFIVFLFANLTRKKTL